MFMYCNSNLTLKEKLQSQNKMYPNPVTLKQRLSLDSAPFQSVFGPAYILNVVKIRIHGKFCDFAFAMM